MSYLMQIHATAVPDQGLVIQLLYTPSGQRLLHIGARDHEHIQNCITLTVDL